jgi:two-component system, OmpR family, copper resistance phosphate regulon response regulator CusR
MRILLVEDDPGTADFIAKGLSQQGNQVETAYDGLSGKTKIEENVYDLVILDVMLPLMNGLELCRHIRQTRTALPVLMLSALSSTRDKVAGLEAGADDYMSKPFHFDELLARIYALRRRRSNAVQVFFHKVSDLEVDVFRRSVRRAGKLIILSATEFSLLELLIANKDRVLSRAFISSAVWGTNFDTGTNVVAVYINYLRSKIDKGFDPPLIYTVVNEGYVLREP